MGTETPSKPEKSPQPIHQTHNVRGERREGLHASGIEQIREILFGALHRELERRLARADAQVAAQSQQLEQTSRRRTEVLEAHVRRETEALTARVERELSDLTEAMRQVGREYRDAIANLEQRVAKVEESSVRAQRDLRNQLLEQAKSFLDELARQRQELLGTLQRELALADEIAVAEAEIEAGVPARH